MLPDPESGSGCVTHFSFQHRVFAAAGSRFKLWGAERRPVFCLDVGKMEGIVELDALCREFGIAHDSQDGRLIKLARDGLRYVPDIKPGDAIPSELLTGEASWSVQRKHVRIAQERLQIQLLSWISGKEVILTDRHEISQYLEQLETREKLRAAFQSAASELNIPNRDTEGVVRLLELLTREVSYIEALRDRFVLVQRLERRLGELIKTYGNDKVGKAEVQRVWQLSQRGAAELGRVFDDIDGQTGEIIAALKGIDRQIAFIRKARDTLNESLKEWDVHIDGQERWPLRRSMETDKAIASLYRFLAARLTTSRSMLAQKTGAAMMKKSSQPPTGAPARNSQPVSQMKEQRR
ncbi:MAG: hypothetical protein IT566_15345 [Rhodospirillaceae bacterium]|nr:hypothetical protein [Rhodospirillaceae bacterium]